ncbi:hypothetical protein B0H65DRAFT_100362 [Neurospora tetraspora]|uniref:Secreted protein n=1 Tax=Neurospora tetraspora TaxID=94610 RepID=A0AAE0MTX1_9PEZI|nr:hypothetical protein B0H65DRAFT_100362 [Neurospora tetraspora]
MGMVFCASLFILMSSTNEGSGHPTSLAPRTISARILCSWEPGSSRQLSASCRGWNEPVVLSGYSPYDVMSLA